MMPRWLVIWLQIAAWQRLASFSGGVALLVWLSAFCWTGPIQLQQKQLEKQRQQQEIHYHQQLRLLRARPALAVLQQQIAQLKSPIIRTAGSSFSLPVLLQASGALLEYWRPAGRGGELSLRLDWSQFIMLLEYLSSLKPVLHIPRFNLQHIDKKQPLLSLVMELTDEE